MTKARAEIKPKQLCGIGQLPVPCKRNGRAQAKREERLTAPVWRLIPIAAGLGVSPTKENAHNPITATWKVCNARR